MLFNSIIFIIFFIIVYLLYSRLKHRPQNVLLLLASYIFYGFWDWRFLSLILISTIIDFYCGNKIYHTKNYNKRKLFLSLSLFANLSILGFFKYFNFFSDNFNQLLSFFGMKTDPFTLSILLPVGISFYTFQTMSYTIDIYKDELEPTNNFLNFATFVSFFPQLVAGPIERAKNLLPQIENPRKVNKEQFQNGLWLILFGYFKKVVIADNMAVVSDIVFNNSGHFHGFSVLIGVYAFTFQIYGDFSGYSDIARGISKLMGIDLMINFKMPYLSKNPREFWDRWHISLSTWLRDYLYIPLGGNRNGIIKTFRNLIITMFLGGLWHGAAWHFIFWGLFHGIILVFHRLVLFLKDFLLLKFSIPEKIKNIIYIFIMFHITCAGWMLFRSNNLSDFVNSISNIFSMQTSLSINNLITLLILVSILFLIDYYQYIKNDIYVIPKLSKSKRVAIYSIIYIIICLFGAVKGYEFIYFQF